MSFELQCCSVDETNKCKKIQIGSADLPGIYINENDGKRS